MTLLTLVLAATVHAQSLEALHSVADMVFSDAVQEPPQAPVLEDGKAKTELSEFLNTLGKPAGAQTLKGAKEPASFLRLADVKNNYWRTNASFPLNGKTATVGFGISRGQQAYLTVVGQDDPQPRWVNIRGLLDDDKKVDVNGRSYNVSLSPDLFDKLGSKLKIKGGGDSRSFSLRDLIGASFSKGFEFPIGSQVYRVFYYDDISESGGYGAPNAAKQDIVLVSREKNDFNIYIVNAEEIPTNQIAVYTLAGGARAGLRMQDNGAVLALFPNP